MQKIFRHPAWATVAAFGTYFCMYGFRKPYTAATYPGASFFHVDYKVLVVVTQTLGYVLAKWIGIKVVSETRPGRRIVMLSGLIAVAELMLLLFGLIPRPWNILCLFLNGLSLGMIFGFVLGFVEGRKHTEALIAGICASFILSDGFSKSVGTALLDRGVSEDWMPCCAGALFLIPTALFIGMLACVPAPSEADVAHRSPRVPMRADARWKFFVKYATGLGAIITPFLFVTLLRSIRADFAPEIWKALGYRQDPSLFTQSELLVSLGVLVISSLAIFIANHYHAFRFSLLSSLAGFLLLPLAVWGLSHGLDKFAFMVLIGFGIYLPYVAVHTTIFERLIALTRERANLGFLMSMADSIGYTGYILLMLFRYTAAPGESVLALLLRGCVWMGVTGGALVLYSSWYFRRKLGEREEFGKVGEMA